MPDWVPASGFRALDDGRLTWRSDIEGRVRWSAAGGEPLIPGLWPYVEAMRCPTLVVRGAESPLFTVEYAERMTAVNPMIRLVTIPDAGHLVHCEQPAAFLDAVIPFLDGMSALETLVAAYEHPTVPDEGVVGYVGADVPRELIAAAGLHPLRLRGLSPSRGAPTRSSGRASPRRRAPSWPGCWKAGRDSTSCVLCHDSDSTVRLFTALRVLARTGPLPELWFLDLLRLPTETTARYNRRPGRRPPGVLRAGPGRPVRRRRA